MTDLARRTFLGASAGLTLAPLLAAAADGDTPPVRVAAIGSGARGSDLIRALSTIDGATIVGVADDYPPHLEQGVKYAGPQAQAFADYRRMLLDLKPAAVVIAVPLHLHFPIAMACFDAGCDVFLEKTMCRTIDEAEQLARRVAESKRVFQIGLQRRAHPIYLQAAAMVEAGMIGDVTAIKAQWHRNNNWRRPIPRPKTDPQWAALERRLNWRLYRDTSAGLMAELGSHQLDVVNWLLKTTPKRVVAAGGIDYWRDGREVFDNIFCTYEYEMPAAGQKPRGPSTAALPPAGPPRTVRVTYSSLGNNAYEGASELILGTLGTLYLTSSKGLLFQEQNGLGTPLKNGTGSEQHPANPQGNGGREVPVPIFQNAAGPDAGMTGGATEVAVGITAGKTLKLSSDPWAFRGQPIEIDIAEGNDTRDELVSFIDHVARQDTATIADARVALADCATVLIANQSAATGGWVDFPARLLAT
ncbi:MAG TPA: Gfo/Idh/MocA family oxidoreductase [Pirellulales bacterium]|jgi:predicted dehydrogenase|nr:Gfo/Idh/MocA family oxidoreductase [Pirellulales bacterium]